MDLAATRYVEQSQSGRDRFKGEQRDARNDEGAK